MASSAAQTHSTLMQHGADLHTPAHAAARAAHRRDAETLQRLAEQDFQACLQSTSQWDHAPLFDALASCMEREVYDWPLLLQIAALLLGEKDRNNGANAAQQDEQQQTTTQSSKTTTPTKKSATSADEDGNDSDDDEEDSAAADAAADAPADEDDADVSIEGVSPDALPDESPLPAADLGVHQSRAFKYLLVAIVRHLAPAAAALSSSASSASASAPSSALTPCPPVLTPKCGDVVGVWLVGLLCASRNRSVAMAFLHTIEVLAGVASLRLTTHKLFQLLQRERKEEGADGSASAALQSPQHGADGSVAHSGASALSSSDLARIVPAHLTTSYLTPSALLPLPPISPRAVQRLDLRCAVLRTLQCIIGDDVMLPSAGTLAPGGSASLDSSLASLSHKGPSHVQLSSHVDPAVWFEFKDTPIFPRISGGASPSAAGYCWSCWINLSSLQDVTAVPPASSSGAGAHQSNVLRFFNDIGFGVQIYIKHNTLCARLLPNSSESIPLKNLLLHPHRWYFLTIVHKPKPAASKAPAPAHPAIPVTSNMANVTSFAKVTSPPPVQPAASYRPSVGASASPSAAMQRQQQQQRDSLSSSPSSPSVPPRPAQIYLYVDGQLVSSNEVAYPTIEGSESMQVSLGGYHGRMASFHFFHDVLSPAAIYSLYTLGAGQYAAPAHHVVNTGLVSVFPPSPSATSLNIADLAGAASNPATVAKDETHALVPHSTPPNIVHHRIVSRVLLSHSPAQTTHEFCLPFAWGDDWNADASQPQGRGAQPYDAATANALTCAAHTLRLPGVGVQHRRNNSQQFVDVGGLKLLLQSLSPQYAGASPVAATDEEVCEILTLLSLSVAANASNANQLLEIGAATLKQLLLEHLKLRHKSALMLMGLKRLLLVVSAVDHSADQSHFASFVSYLLLDLTYWRGCSTHVLSLVVHLLKLLVLHNPRPFIVHPSIGVTRIIDSIRVLTHRFFAPESVAQAGAGSTAPTPLAVSPMAQGQSTDAASAAARRGSLPSFSTLSVPLQINTDVHSPLSALHPYSPSALSPLAGMSPTALALPCAHPSDGELDLVKTLLSVSVEIAKQSLSSQHFESHILAPFLHLLQLSTVSASNFPPVLLVHFLHTFLAIIPISSHRTLTFLHAQNAAHIFLRLLFLDDVEVRTLALRCIQYINSHLVRLAKLERSKAGSSGTSISDSMHLQSDMATAIHSCLSLHTPISHAEHDALFQLLMGQVPEAAETTTTPAPAPHSTESGASAPGGSSSSSSAPAPKSRSHRGLSLETGLAFCHSAYLSVTLELCVWSSRSTQSKLLLDLLTLLRSNPHNVLVMASLFWQKLLLPFLSKLQPVKPNAATAAAAGSDHADGGAGDGDDDAEGELTLTGESAASDSDTIDVLVYQLLNLLLVHCMTNEPRGWQVLDQILWCLDERERARMASVVAAQTQAQAAGGVSESDLHSGTVSEQWTVQVSIFNRLFQSLHRSVAYLSLPPNAKAGSSGTVSSSGTADGPSSSHSASAFGLHSEGQIFNLRRNIPAVFELTEWLLFHSPHSFLSTDSQPGMARRTSSGADRADGSSSSSSGGGGGGGGGDETRRKESLPGGPGSEQYPSAPDAHDEGVASLLDANVASVNPSGPPPTNPQPQPNRRGSTMGGGGYLGANATALAATAAFTRASLRTLEEPLTPPEIEVLAGLLSGVLKNYPLPERRQDVLRVMFRYLLVVLPHPLCASLCPLICECVLTLFTERIPDLSEKNNRLIALSLSLLKKGMEVFLRRGETQAAEHAKSVMGALYARCGPQVFLPALPDLTTPSGRGSVVASSRGSVSGGMVLPATSKTATAGKTSQSSSGGGGGGELDLLSGAEPSASSSETAPSSGGGGGDQDGPGSSPLDSSEDPVEQVLFHLYSGEAQALIEFTQQIFEQHELRLGYLCEARAKQVAESISAYLKKHASVENRREKNFSLASMDVLRRVQRERPFLGPQYQVKTNNSKVIFRAHPRDKKHALKVHKLLKHFHYQHANTRPRPLLPSLLPEGVLAMLSSAHDAFSPYARAHELPGPRLNFSGQVEFWKLDSTESPTRTRRIVKKNFRGSDHRAASASAATGKTAILAPQALDLATSLKAAVVKAGEGSANNSGVDADALLAGEMQSSSQLQSQSGGPSTPAVAPMLSTGESAAAASSALEEAEDEGGLSDDDEGVGAEDDDDAGASSSSGSKKRSKYLMTRDCVMITAERRYSGSIRIAQQHLLFVGTEMVKVEHGSSSSSGSGAASPTDSGAAAARKPRKLKEKYLRWPLKHIRMVLPRLYLLRESALEIFFNNFKNTFFNFTPLDDETAQISWNANDGSKGKTPASGSGSGSGSASAKSKNNPKLRSGREQRNEVYKLLCSLCPEMQFELSPGRRLVKSGIMKKWQRGEISNFDYLMHLNTVAGRSYNDINQYPVFPWVLTDYKSPSIDLADPRVYRDLAKPIGALNEDRFEIYSERFQTFDDPEIPGFMYGSHYSSAGIALYYLLRLEPFTSLAVSLQGSHFDLADRLFDSISGAWDLSLTNLGDVKELIPEFFYLPDFLRNLNGLDLGVKQDRQRLGDVVLPPWAKGSPEEFVRINRAALESEHVSAHLHEWIDLIFGYKQKGKAAVDASNVFFYLTYAGAVDIDAIDNPALRKATEDQIAHFGQTPAQLLTSPHPPRYSAADRAKLAAGNISLPAKLNSTFSSQLIHYYQPSRSAPPTPAVAAATLAAQKRAATKAKLAQNKTMGSFASMANPPGGAPAVLEPIAQPAPAAAAPMSLAPDAHHGRTFESERASIVAQVPVTLCFAAHSVVIGVTAELALQTHALHNFIAQPATLLPPPPDVATATSASTTDGDASAQRTADAEAGEHGSNRGSRSGSDAAENEREQSDEKQDVDAPAEGSSVPVDPLAEADELAPQLLPSATEALTAASSLVVSTLTAAPTMLRKQLLSMLPAQQVPPAVQSSHVVHPMCRHWFLDPAIKPNPQASVTLSGGDADAPAAAASPDLLSPPAARLRASSSQQVSPSRSRSPQSPASSGLGPDAVTMHPCVAAVALNAQFLFSGGYFDGSLKCHSILHFKVEDAPAAGAAAPGESLLSPKHHRNPTSPSVMVTPDMSALANDAESGGGGVVSHPPILTRRTADCKPLSTVQVHHAPITAICLAHNQSILLTGDAAGSLCVWRVFTERHERNRPPLSSAPIATFTVHEGKVRSIASNTYVGVAVSLAMDMQGQRGCELCVFSVRGGTARFIRSQVAVDPATDWQQVVLTSNASIVIYGSQGGVPMLWLYSLNGHLLRTLPTDEVINVLYATPATAKTTAYDGFVVTGGRKSVVVFRSPHTLEPVQSFFCDDLYPQSIAHGSGCVHGAAAAAAQTNAASAAPAPAAAAAAAAPKDLWDGSSSSDGAAASASSSSASSQAADAPAAEGAAAAATAAPLPVALPVAAPPVDSEAAAFAAHLDPLTESLAKDTSLSLRMGVASFDISPSQQHFVVALYPDAFPPVPQQMEADDASPNAPPAQPAQPAHIEGRLLLFPLPHSSHDISTLGFYLDYGLNTLELVRDALSSRISDTRDLARERIEAGFTRATEKLQVAKSKIFSAFSGFFGGKKATTPSAAAASSASPAQ